jgi:DNA polymerase I-like protein with 3'-5' exonuclease and polymerase domains
VPIPATGIIRRGATRTAAANTGFQSLGAIVATRGLYLIARAQMLGKLPGRACAFVHDEVISDCKVEDVPEVAAGHERLMLQAAEEIMPDVKMGVETTAMDHWSKKARKTTDAAGQLAVTAA